MGHDTGLAGISRGICRRLQPKDALASFGVPRRPELGARCAVKVTSTAKRDGGPQRPARRCAKRLEMLVPFEVGHKLLRPATDLSRRLQSAQSQELADALAQR